MKDNGCICNQHYCHLLFHTWTFVPSNIEFSVSVLNGQLTISTLIRKPTGYPVSFLFPYPEHNVTRFCNLLQQFGAYSFLKLIIEPKMVGIGFMFCSRNDPLQVFFDFVRNIYQHFFNAPNHNLCKIDLLKKDLENGDILQQI